MLAKDQSREELAEHGFVPYGEVVRLRRLCGLAWALLAVVLIVVWGATIHGSGSFQNEVTSPRGHSQPDRVPMNGSSMRPLLRAPRLGSLLVTFLVDTGLQIG